MRSHQPLVMELVVGYTCKTENINGYTNSLYDEVSLLL